MIDKAAQRGVIKRETASRKISRLTVAVQKLA
jgi:ribosomal protein S20